jgi:hypothetical protein
MQETESTNFLVHRERVDKDYHLRMNYDRLEQMQRLEASIFYDNYAGDEFECSQNYRVRRIDWQPDPHYETIPLGADDFQTYLSSLKESSETMWWA